MEKLKPFKEVMQPDSRWQCFLLADRDSDKRRPMMLQDVYQSAARITLHDGVPEVVRSHFAAAQNLLVYSWFYYPFNVTAQFLACVTVELALKERFKGEPNPSFKKLLKLAAAQGLVKDKDFTHIRERSETEPSIGQDIEFVSQPLKSYTDSLIENLPHLRNELAHGSPMLHPLGASWVRVCADLINQLFPRPSS